MIPWKPTMKNDRSEREWTMCPDLKTPELSEHMRPSYPKTRRRFSRILMATIISLVTISVVVVLSVLNRYLSKRVEDEFRKELRAQKGQIEILIRNRRSEVKNILEDFSSDNTIRATMMLDAKSKLIQYFVQSYPPGQGIYYFIQQKGFQSIFPDHYEGLSKKTIHYIFNTRPYGDIVREGNRNRLSWLFSRPIMDTEGDMGTAAIIYDMTEDKKLHQAFRSAIDGDLVLLHSGSLVSLTTGTSIPLNPKHIETIAENSQVFTLVEDFAFSKITGSRYLYAISSSEVLKAERKWVTLLMGLFSVLVIAVSMLISAFIAGRMVRPLKEMTRKAIQISQGNEGQLTFEKGASYWEFEQMSQAFNTMLSHLKEAEERSRYKELLENVDDAVYILDKDGAILEANAAAYTSLGFSRGAFLSLKLESIVPRKEAQTIIEQSLSAKNAQPEKLTVETLHRKKDGTSIPVEIHSRPIIYMGQQVILNVARDITERIEAEKALRASEERYRSVVENSNDGILILDSHLHILYANSVMTNILDYKPVELEGKNFYTIFHKESANQTKKIISENGMGKTSSQDHCQVIRKSGEIRTVRIGTYQFADSSGETKSVIQVTDITDQLKIEEEKKLLEAQLNHAQKMEAMGTMAGCIAHDFNNLLMNIRGRLEIMRLKSNPDSPDSVHMDAIDKTVDDATRLTKQLLGFARKGEEEITPIDVNAVVEESTRMFISARKEINLRFEFNEQLWTVNADRGQLEQVLVNLYVNAWQAMSKGGDLTIYTENVYLDDSFCKPFEIPFGNYVNIRVSDTGPGMSREIMDKIFDPFFTTKDTTEGTGLGLASAYGIIRNHGGIILVESELGSGTTFNIYLPTSTSDADS
jgi:PAS domain S-box-containing protein